MILHIQSCTLLDLLFRYTHPIQVGWCSRNAGAVASRTVNASLYNMYGLDLFLAKIPFSKTLIRFVQASSIVSANIYRTDDAPRCQYILIMYWERQTQSLLDRRGNAILIGINLFNIVIMYPGVKAYYMWRNKKRDATWNAMTSEVWPFFTFKFPQCLIPLWLGKK